MELQQHLYTREHLLEKAINPHWIENVDGVASDWPQFCS